MSYFALEANIATLFLLQVCLLNSLGLQFGKSEVDVMQDWCNTIFCMRYKLFRYKFESRHVMQLR